MKSSVSLAWLFPLAMCGFAADSVPYLDIAFTSVTRWFGLLALASFLLHRGALFQALRLGTAPMLAAWLAWNVATTLWSQQAELSLVKSLAMVLTAVTFVSGGLYWARSRPDAPLSYLVPFLALTLLAGLPLHGGLVHNSAGVRLYEGLASNPNFLGEVAAISLTYAFYAVYQARQSGDRVALALWLVIAAVLGALLVASGARAAMFSAVPAFMVFAVLMVKRRSLVVLAASLSLLIGVVLVLPDAVTAPFAGPVVNLATKGQPGFLFSRTRTWERSYDKAREGAVAGLGFGVSAGATNDFQLGRLTTGKYTREKSNAQLAMVEETGLIGLAAFVIFLVQSFAALAAGISHAEGRVRIELLFVASLLAGLTIHSAFESWWTAPGSLEAPVFWASIGVAAGLLERLRPVTVSTPLLAPA
jgi:O-antigen ligase